MSQPLSFHMVEDMLAYRGIIFTHKTVCEWAEKFGRDYANAIRRRTPRLGDKWHLDEAVRSGHRQHKGLNNRAENSHQPLRRRERIMKYFKSV